MLQFFSKSMLRLAGNRAVPSAGGERAASGPTLAFITQGRQRNYPEQYPASLLSSAEEAVVRIAPQARNWRDLLFQKEKKRTGKWFD